MTVKAITLWQPYATLIAIGAKRFETRKWNPTCYGPLAIHASARKVPQCIAFCSLEPFRTALAQAGYSALNLPMGQIVAMRWVQQTHSTEILREGLSEQELAFGDFSDGRRAWELVGNGAFDPPIAAVGAQGVWDWRVPEAHQAQIRKLISTLEKVASHVQDQV